MKTVRMIGLALFAILLYVNFTSCSSNDDVEPDAPQKPKEYVVSLGFTGEISVSESPLSRASGNDLYGILVYSCPNVDGSTTYTKFAHGLFDDTSSMTIKLPEGYKYKFIVTMVVDGKNKIEVNGNVYYTPFNAELTNSFTYTKTISMSNITSGKAQLVRKGEVRIPQVDRYHGITSDYIPEKDGKVSIFMKRTVFGAKFIAENLLGEDKISITFNSYTPDMEIIHPETEAMGIFTFYDITKAYSEENYSETISTELIWTKADGVVVPLGTHYITFKRNVLTTVTIKVADVTTENGIGFELETTEMGAEDKTIENGEIVDTNVTPETGQ